MRIGILGTGNLAANLAQAWAGAGHEILVAGRSLEKASAIGEAVAPGELAGRGDVVVVAVAWAGIDEALALAGPLAGATLIDATNAVDFTTGLLVGFAAEHIAAITGANVVKALHLFSGASWLAPPSDTPRTVAICGDDTHALETSSELIRDLGAVPVVVGGLAIARQLEGVAGVVMRIVAAGYNPVTAVPYVSR
jgi:predicted dinucleotide-binding enzyme